MYSIEKCDEKWNNKFYFLMEALGLDLTDIRHYAKV